MALKHVAASCRCGKVVLDIAGPPILHGICYCADCQEAGRQYQAVPGADTGLGADGGTDFVLYRKDRVRGDAGEGLLEERRLTPDSSTRRLYARCCNTAMFLDFTKGHCLTVFRGSLPAGIPPATMRVMTDQRPAGVILPGDT